MPSTETPRATDSWWRDAVIYQIYPRSYADSNGDGVGDLRGIIGRLDHLAWLGVDAIWLSPINPSPNADWGYDVADYTGVDPALGTVEDAEALIRAAGAHGIRVLLDLVPNHTSDQHPWFVDAQSGRDSGMRDWYVWADPAADGGPPNNWLSHFGGPAWTLDDASGQYFLHNFLAEQPDLNYWNEDVRAAMEGVIQTWFDRGVAGFRIDVCHGIVKDRELRDNPPAPPGTPAEEASGPLAWEQDRRFNMNRPEVHEVLRSWRRIADRAGERVLLGETWAPDVEALAKFYGADLDELQLAFNFLFTMSEPRPRELADHVRGMLDAIPAGAQPSWVLSNHDISRCATRWCGGDARLAATAMLMLLTIPGTPTLYYGDEIGMLDVDVPADRLLDPVGVRGLPGAFGRDSARTPMQWNGERDAGFGGGAVEPWLPIGDVSEGGARGGRTVAAQLADPGSILHLVRDVIALRRSQDELRRGQYCEHFVDERAWAWRRGDSMLVACNFDAAHEAIVPQVRGRVLVASDRSLEGVDVAGGLRLPPGAGAIVELDPQSSVAGAVAAG